MKSILCMLGLHKFKRLEEAIDGFGEPAAACARCAKRNGRALRTVARISNRDWDAAITEKSPFGMRLIELHGEKVVTHIMLRRKGLRVTDDLQHPVDKPYMSYHDAEKDEVVFIQGEQ